MDAIALMHALGAQGFDPYFDANGDNTVKTVRSNPGRMQMLRVANPNASDCWIQLFDESGAITVGSTTPIQSYLVPTGDGVNHGLLEQAIGINFRNSIKYACTTTPTGDVAPANNLIVNALHL